MTHLAHEEMLRWRDGGDEGDRARVLGHLAACDECRQQYADLVREGESADAATDLVAEAIPPGLQAYPAAAPPRAGTRWTLWAVSGLAAALLVGTAVMVLGPRPSSQPAQDDTVRGDEIQLLAPVGTVTGPVAFRWSSPVRAARYRVWVHDEAGGVVYSTLAAEESATPPTEVAALLRAGARYSWQVEAYDAKGELQARSPELQFTPAR
jgi:hypothetical protein